MSPCGRCVQTASADSGRGCPAGQRCFLTRWRTGVSSRMESTKMYLKSDALFHALYVGSCNNSPANGTRDLSEEKCTLFPQGRGRGDSIDRARVGGNRKPACIANHKSAPRCRCSSLQQVSAGQCTDAGRVWCYAIGHRCLKSEMRPEHSRWNR